MFKKSHIITGIKSWKFFSEITNLSGKNQMIDHRFLTIRDVNHYAEKFRIIDVKPMRILSEYVKIENCDKNFVCVNLHPFLFRNIKILYLNSPCDEKFLITWDRSTTDNFIGILNPKYVEYFYKYYQINSKNKKWIIGDDSLIDKLKFI